MRYIAVLATVLLFLSACAPVQPITDPYALKAQGQYLLEAADQSIASTAQAQLSTQQALEISQAQATLDQAIYLDGLQKTNVAATQVADAYNFAVRQTADAQAILDQSATKTAQVAYSAIATADMRKTQSALATLEAKNQRISEQREGFVFAIGALVTIFGVMLTAVSVRVFMPVLVKLAGAWAMVQIEKMQNQSRFQITTEGVMIVIPQLGILVRPDQVVETLRMLPSRLPEQVYVEPEEIIDYAPPPPIVKTKQEKPSYLALVLDALRCVESTDTNVFPGHRAMEHKGWHSTKWQAALEPLEFAGWVETRQGDATYITPEGGGSLKKLVEKCVIASGAGKMPGEKIEL